MRTFRIALAQTNPTVGDLDGNTSRIIDYIDRARDLGADLVAFPELAIPGYPPEDLLFKPQFIQDNIRKIRQVASASRDIAVVVGFADANSYVYNAAAVLYDGEVVGKYHKIYLPNYGVFDEERYFQAGSECPVFSIAGTPVGVNICEDIWFAVGPTVVQRAAGAEVIVNISASPFHAGKRRTRERMLSVRAADNEMFVAYVNMVGGQDELIFDGGSIIHDPLGEEIARGRQFEEDLVVADLEVGAVFRSRLRDTRPRSERSGSLDEVGKAVRVDVSDAPAGPRRASETPPTCGDGCAAGRRRRGVRGPGSRHPRLRPQDGIRAGVRRAVGRDRLQRCGHDRSRRPWPRKTSLGWRCLPATRLRDRSWTREALPRPLGWSSGRFPSRGRSPPTWTPWSLASGEANTGIAEENLQSRTRGMLVMALANKFGGIVLTTGNKSEMAVGYATIYGDMAGGYAVIKDVPKTLVYDLAEYRNSLGDRPRDTRVCPDEAAQRRAAPRPEGRGQPAALRGAGPHPQGLRRG